MFSMIRPVEEPMAIDMALLENEVRGQSSRRRELHRLFWLCGWGGAAAIALTGLAITSQTRLASERLRSVFASEPAAVAQMPPRVAQLEYDTRLLIEQVRALRSDRDRLQGRIALLESTIDDMTGAIKKQAAATSALAAKAPPQLAPSAATLPTAVASAAAVKAGVPTAQSIEPTASVAAAPPATTPETTSEEAAKIPLPLARAATASASEPSRSSQPRSEFALDLGGAPTLDGIRQRWIGMKANFGPLLSGMHPLAARDRRPGNSGYRLLVGPLPNSPVASGLCAHFNAAHTACRAVRFEGEALGGMVD
ncbi:MAG TPA: hypothetical protein VFP60_09940 [Pseudolabrys sp.]|nr:hypothetical protein [Pseudolabrys sp.]